MAQPVRSVVITTKNPSDGAVSAKTFANTDFREGGRLYISDSQNTPIEEVIRYRPVGVTGNFVNRTGFAGQELTFLVQYVGTIDDAMSDYLVDASEFKGRSSSITINYGAANTTYGRCTCSNMTIVSGPKGLALPGKEWCRYIVKCEFMAEQPAN